MGILVRKDLHLASRVPKKYPVISGVQRFWDTSNTPLVGYRTPETLQVNWNMRSKPTVSWPIIRRLLVKSSKVQLSCTRENPTAL